MTQGLKTQMTSGVLVGGVALVASLFGRPHLSTAVVKDMAGLCVLSLLLYLPIGLFGESETLGR
jgi:hypothetical protein